MNVVVWISIFVPLTVLLMVISIIILFIYRIKNRQHQPYISNFIYKLDIRNRKTIFIGSFNRKQNPFIISNKKHWFRVSKILDSFKSPEAKKLFQKAFHDLENGEDNIHFSFIDHSLIDKKNYYDVVFRFNKFDFYSDFIMNIRFIRRPEPKKPKTKIHIIEKKEILDSHMPIKAFIAFNFRNSQHSDDFLGRMLQLIQRHLGDRKINYLIRGKLLILVVQGYKMVKVKKEVYKIRKKITTKDLRYQTNQLYNASSFVVSKEIKSLKSINSVFNVLEYLINKSIITNNKFITYNSSIDKESYIRFVEGSKLFRQSIRAKNIQINKIPVRMWKNNRKVIYYITPTINKINTNLLTSILRNKYNEEDLINTQANLIGIKEQINENVLLDINSVWLIENQKKLKYKKAIYLINPTYYKGDSSELQKTIYELKNKHFVFGLRLTKYNEQIVGLIQTIKPPFLVIDSSFFNKNNLLDSKVISSLSTIKEISNNLSIKIIYESPPTSLDLKTMGKIGLSFYYNL